MVSMGSIHQRVLVLPGVLVPPFTFFAALRRNHLRYYVPYPIDRNNHQAGSRKDP